ncbi:hypothetical protein TCAL_01422 [Tigriopus californicus]|uniref:Dynein assembly factor 3, axonemal homolog n=1 Tax=Tigriopus californicus TaxID=6832 RepID=A0A553NSJ3_TIGCA|nr:dynein axonemal assembly factor 3-like [Tigriopus californicus]TRY68388.1 hypothetical protein TCAL_01422 [Tigriopus californicus]
MSEVSDVDMGALQAGLGGITWWGFSPTTGVLSDLPKDEGCNHVLLVGSGDGRHILDFLLGPDSDSGQVNFYVLEQNVALYARQLLFLAIWRHAEASDKAKIFMETFGNLRVSSKTAHAIRSWSAKLEQWVHERPTGDTNGSFLSGVALGKLKSKERDDLADVFKHWKQFPTEYEDAASGFWEERTRRLLLDQFGAREGVIDMDYRLRLVERGGSIISLLEYSDWRLSGNAFIFDEEKDQGEEMNKTQTNPTLISSLLVKDPSSRKKVPQYGFWGDIVTGPFFSFGYPSSTQPLASSIDLTQTRLKRTATSKTLNYFQSRLDSRATLRTESSAPQPHTITFLPVSSGEKDLLVKSKYHQKFDKIFIGCSVAHFLDKALFLNLKNSQRGSELAVESPRYLLHLAYEVEQKFKEQLICILKEYEDTHICRLVDGENEEQQSPAAVIRVKVVPK